MGGDETTLDQSGADTQPQDTQNAEHAADQQTDAAKPTLEEFLADESNKAAYDAAIEEAVTAALEKQKADEEEAKRVAELSDEERLAEQKQQLAEREAKLAAAERKSEAVVELGNAGIPAKLADCLNYTSKEAYEKSLTAAKEAFQAAVETAVNDRLRGKRQLAADSGTAKALSGQQVSADNDFAAILRDNQAKR